MPYPNPHPESLHDWAALANVDEIVAQALHAITDPVERPVEDILAAPMPGELGAIKSCCNQWMTDGHYPRQKFIKFDICTLRIYT